MIVEFAGRPATGKSTVADKLKPQGWTVVQAENKIELLWCNLVFLLYYPIRFFTLFFVIVRNAVSLKVFYLLFMNSFLHANAKYMKARRYEKAIIDQGHVQNIFSVFSHKLSQKETKRYMRWTMEPDHLFLFVAPKRVRERRMNERGYGVREEMNAKKRQKWQKAAAANTAVLKKYIEDKRDATVIDASQSRNEVYEDILRVVTNK